MEGAERRRIGNEAELAGRAGDCAGERHGGVGIALGFAPDPDADATPSEIDVDGAQRRDAPEQFGTRGVARGLEPGERPAVQGPPPGEAVGSLELRGGQHVCHPSGARTSTTRMSRTRNEHDTDVVDAQ